MLSNFECLTFEIFSKDHKLQCIALRDEGKTTEEIAQILDTAKSNVEKWCSAKVTIVHNHLIF